jgi:hypothetical protein
MNLWYNPSHRQLNKELIMKTINVSEASGQALDWLVARCEGKRPSMFIFAQTGALAPAHNYSTDWAHGGVIVDREGITVGPYYEKSKRIPNAWSAYIGWDSVEHDPLHESDGPTPLIAAMRCFCVSKLGNVVEVPDELA